MCFFFQAEDGIRDWSVTGVQTCALPISVQQRDAPAGARRTKPPDPDTANPFDALFGLEHIPAQTIGVEKIGRASCRERVEGAAVRDTCKKNTGAEGGAEQYADIDIDRHV